MKGKYVETEYDAYTKKYHITNLPLTLESYEDIYKLCYLIAYTLLNVKGLTPLNTDYETDPIVKAYDKNIVPDMYSFNFGPLIETIKNIIDHTYYEE